MSERPFLLDTCIILIWTRGGERAEQLRDKYGAALFDHSALVSIVSHAEILVLARRNEWGSKRLVRLQELLDSFVTIDLLPEVVSSYVEVEMYSSKVEGGARNMGKNDVWIAASAKAANARLLTSDKDFAHFTPDFLHVEQF